MPNEGVNIVKSPSLGELSYICKGLRSAYLKACRNPIMNNADCRLGASLRNWRQVAALQGRKRRLRTCHSHPSRLPLSEIFLSRS